MSDNKNLSRRDFLKTAGTVSTGSLLAATGELPRLTPNPRERHQHPPCNDSAIGKSGVAVRSKVSAACLTFPRINCS